MACSTGVRMHADTNRHCRELQTNEIMHSITEAGDECQAAAQKRKCTISSALSCTADIPATLAKWACERERQGQDCIQPTHARMHIAGEGGGTGGRGGGRGC